MERSVMRARLEHESSTGVARVGLALSLGLALWLGDHLFLRALVGSLGMYAVTDGVFASLASGPRLARVAGAISVAFGFSILLFGVGERGLLALFALRSLAVALVGLFGAGAGALRRYALLSLAGTSAMFLVLAGRGHGALELSGWIAAQLVLWGVLLARYAQADQRC